MGSLHRTVHYCMVVFLLLLPLLLVAMPLVRLLLHLHVMIQMLTRICFGRSVPGKRYRQPAIPTLSIRTQNKFSINYECFTVIFIITM